MLIRGLLASLLCLTPFAAQADWHEVSSEHFVIYSDEKPDRLKSFATELERFDSAVRYMLNRDDEPVGPANRVTVYVVPDIKAVEQLAGRKEVGGFYRPQAGGSFAIIPRRLSVYDDTGAQAILLHEYAHHLILSLFPNAAYPSWFSEGYAEFWATAEFDDDGAVSIGLPAQHRAYGIMMGNRLPIEKLLTSSAWDLKGDEKDALYGRGWLLTHYLVLGGKRPGQLSKYVAAINDGASSVEAATKVFGDVKALDRELESYKRSRLTARKLSGSATSVGEIKVRKLTAGEAATMPVRIRSKNGVDETTAPGVYADAKKAAGAYANDPGTQIVLAEAAYDAKDYAGAEAAADRAIAADAKAIDALVYKAMAKTEIAKKNNDGSRATMLAIQRLLARANAIDPDDPEPLILFYRSFMEFGERPSRNAIDSFYTTFATAPHDRGLRLNIAMTYLNDGKPQLARELLRPLAFDPHERGLAEHASKLIAQIDAKSGKRSESAGSNGEAASAP